MAFIFGAATVHLNTKDFGFYYFNGTDPLLSDNYTFHPSQFASYTYLDYVLVGGGGGGAIGTIVSGNSNGAGGGGSGFLLSSFDFSGNNHNFIYNAPQVSGTTINLTGVTSIQVQIGSGGNGATSAGLPAASGAGGLGTQLVIVGPSPQTVIAPGGAAGLGSDNDIYNGYGGTGFNGGGGGGFFSVSSQRDGGGGIGNTANGGMDGESSQVIYSPFGIMSGVGGGIGSGNDYTVLYNSETYGPFQQSNVGGGGAAGTCVLLQSGANTGGSGTGGIVSDVTLASFPPATSGVDYTGAGGGGGAVSQNTSSSVTNYNNGGNGGKGYAILWFHN